MAEIITPALEAEILALPTDPVAPDLCLRYQFVQERLVVDSNGQPYPVCRHCPPKISHKCRLLQLKDFDLF